MRLPLHLCDLGLLLRAARLTCLTLLLPLPLLFLLRPLVLLRRLPSPAAALWLPQPLAPFGPLGARPICARLAGPLLELANLLLHEPLRLLILLRPQRVVSAVGATDPAFWVRVVAGRAEDAFRERHRRTARIVHFSGG